MSYFNIIVNYIFNLQKKRRNYSVSLKNLGSPKFLGVCNFQEVILGDVLASGEINHLESGENRQSQSSEKNQSPELCLIN